MGLLTKYASSYSGEEQERLEARFQSIEQFIGANTSVVPMTAANLKTRLDGGGGLISAVNQETLAVSGAISTSLMESIFLPTDNSVAATASLTTTTPIVLTSVATGTARNTKTFETLISAAAANPTNTILATFAGTAAAVTLTIVPNDGTHNSATPVNLTTAQVAELINTGAVAGKSVTVTDTSSRRVLQTATGGDTTVVVHSGEGDAVTGTFASGAAATTKVMSLAAPASEGLIKVCRLSTNAGLGVVTVSGTNIQSQSGKTASFSTAGDALVLRSVGSLWVVDGGNVSFS